MDNVKVHQLEVYARDCKTAHEVAGDGLLAKLPSATTRASTIRLNSQDAGKRGLSFAKSQSSAAEGKVWVTFSEFFEREHWCRVIDLEHYFRALEFLVNERTRESADMWLWHHKVWKKGVAFSFEAVVSAPSVEEAFKGQRDRI